MKQRTKKLFAWLMTFAMLLSLCPVISVTAMPTGTEITGTTTISQNGDYYLTRGVEGDITVNSGVTATLDLQGYTLAGTTGVTLNGDKFTLSRGAVNQYVKGTGILDINADLTVKAKQTGGEDNGGIKADGGTLQVNVADGVTLNSNIMALGSGNEVDMTTGKNATIKGTEYGEIVNAYSGGAVKINAENAKQNLTKKC